MNRLLAAFLSMALAGNVYLAWYLHSRIEPNTAQLDSDLANLKAQRAAIANREIEGDAKLLDAILAQTQAMLEQKRAAALRFIDLRYQVDGQPFLPPPASDLALIGDEIAEQEKLLGKAREEFERFSGGLIRVVIEMRVEIGELTLAILRQRQILLSHGITLPAHKVPVGATSPELLAEIEGEIQRKTTEIENTEAEARRYTGGLIQVTLLMRAETEKLSLAMLQQRRLSLKYQIGLPTIGVPAGGNRGSTKPPGKIVDDKEALQ